jgi:hypothetical protein
MDGDLDLDWEGEIDLSCPLDWKSPSSTKCAHYPTCFEESCILDCYIEDSFNQDSCESLRTENVPKTEDQASIVQESPSVFNLTFGAATDLLRMSPSLDSLPESYKANGFLDDEAPELMFVLEL